ncbi:hypothetical protein [Amycolatopsis sp. NPDC058986]
MIAAVVMVVVVGCDAFEAASTAAAAVDKASVSQEDVSPLSAAERGDEK